MKAFAEAWPDEAILQEALAKLTWFHNLTLLEKIQTQQERLWYARAAIEHGWSRNVLVIHICGRSRSVAGDEFLQQPVAQLP